MYGWLQMFLDFFSHKLKYLVLLAHVLPIFYRALALSHAFLGSNSVHMLLDLYSSRMFNCSGSSKGHHFLYRWTCFNAAIANIFKRLKKGLWLLGIVILKVFSMNSFDILFVIIYDMSYKRLLIWIDRFVMVMSLHFALDIIYNGLALCISYFRWTLFLTGWCV